MKTHNQIGSFFNCFIHYRFKRIERHQDFCDFGFGITDQQTDIVKIFGISRRCELFKMTDNF